MSGQARDRGVLWPLALGTFLNPFNSSMLAVALVALRDDFGLSVKDVTWIISVFYISSAAGQPLMGRLVDRFGPRRLFGWGMCIVVVGSAGAAVAPTWSLLCLSRVVTAIGTATAFPSAVAVLEHHVEPQRRTGGLASLQLANNIGASLGPVVGGFILMSGEWRPIFAASTPMAVASFIGAVVLVPKDHRRTSRPWRLVLRESDLPGVAMFVLLLVSAMLSATGAFPGSSVAGGALALIAAAAFTMLELRAPEPFLDLRRLVHNGGLMKVYSSWILLCSLYYLVMLGMPQLLQDQFDMPSGTVGLLIFPIAVFAAVVNPLASRMLIRWGVRCISVMGAILSVVTCACCAAIAVNASVWIVLAASALMGMSSGILAVALAQGMYLSTTPDIVGVAAGLFQTSRYLGALAAAVVIGAVFGEQATIRGWLLGLGLASSGCILAAVLSGSWTPRRR